MISNVVKLPALTLLATIGFLVLFQSDPVGSYQHHRWRHRERSSSDSDFWSLCSRCPPGFGVAHRCTLVHDTVCHSCPKGFYAPGHSRKHACWPCSSCGEGLYEVHRCTVSRDTVCEPCVSRRRPERSGKCSVFLLQLQQQQEHRHQEEVNEDEEDEDDDEEEDDANAGSVPSTTQRSSTLSDVDGPLRLPENNASEDLSLLGLYRSETNDEEVAVGVAQLAAFQVVLIFTAVAAILALTCRLRVFSSHEPTRLKLAENHREDGVALIEHLTAVS